MAILELVTQSQPRAKKKSNRKTAARLLPFTTAAEAKPGKGRKKATKAAAKPAKASEGGAEGTGEAQPTA